MPYFYSGGIPPKLPNEQLNKRMKTRVLMILAAVLAAVNLSFAWGPKGHAVVADIAARHISKKTAQKIDAVLGGETMVDVSSWADNVRKDPRYAHTATWHFVNVDPGYTYQTMPKDPAGDVYVKLLEIVEALKSDTLSAEQEKVNLMLLIHLVGDLHCPMHVGHRDDLGGNRIPVQWFGQPTNLHSVWDSKLVDSCRPWSYSEWTENIDRNLTPEQIRRITQLSVMEWMEQTMALCEDIYANTPSGGNYSYDYCFQYAPAVKQQFLQAGLRLARLLEEIYGDGRVR